MSFNDNCRCEVCTAIDRTGEHDAAIIARAAAERAYGQAQVIMAAILDSLGVKEALITADRVLAINEALENGELVWEESDLGESFHFRMREGDGRQKIQSVDGLLKSLGLM